ncbi:MAG: PAS domain-containing protein [Minicystis sp.]
MKFEPTSDIPAASEGASGAATPRKSSLHDAHPPSVMDREPVTPHSARVPPATLDFALLRGALEEIPFGVATTRGDVVLYANESLNRMFGVSNGGLERKGFGDLFAPASYAEISRALAEARVFDGRVVALVDGGREVPLDVHIEWYSSEAQGTGGFVVAREVALELGALGRLVEQLGGALFRIRVGDGTLESVSPAITKLTGLDPTKCITRPVLLTTLVSSEERERVGFLYRRMAKGELLSANAQVSLRREGGITRLVQIRATARRDAGGAVRHIDGIVIDAARDPDAASASLDVRDGGAADRDRDPAARATMDLTYEMLRETSQHLTMLFREVRSIRNALKAHAPSLPADIVSELTARIDAVAAAAGATGALNRGVRHALARASMGATLGEVLEGVRATLGPSIGDASIRVDAGDAGSMVIPERVDELTLALTHLALRAFRFAGSGSLRICARRTPPPPPDPRHPPMRTGRRPPERDHAVVEIIADAPADLADAAMEISSDMLRTVPRPDEADHAHQAAQMLIAAAGGMIETDDATFSMARSVVRLKA